MYTKTFNAAAATSQKHETFSFSFTRVVFICRFLANCLQDKIKEFLELCFSLLAHIAAITFLDLENMARSRLIHSLFMIFSRRSSKLLVIITPDAPFDVEIVYSTIFLFLNFAITERAKIFLVQNDGSTCVIAHFSIPV